MYEIDCNNIGRVLRDDWKHLACGRRTRDTVSRWAVPEPALGGFESLHDVVAEIEGATLERSIEITQAVLRLAKSEELAHRALIQVMVPMIATESYRSLRILRQVHHHAHSAVRPRGADVVDLVLSAAAEAVACYAGRTLKFPLRTLRRRFIELIVQYRTKIINAETLGFSLSGLAPGASGGAASRSGRETEDAGEAHLAMPERAPGPSELLAETLETAVQLGIVTEEDAALVWASRYHQQTSFELGGNDRREVERLRRRRSRAQQRLVANRDALLEAGVAV